MPIDPSLMPTTLDAVHLGLAGLVLLLLLLLVIFLTLGLTVLIRRRPPPEPIAVNVERVPAALLPAAGPLRVAIETVPANLLAAAQPVAAPAATVPPAPRAEPVVVKEATPDAALQLLGLLQKEARFVDFIEEDIAQFQDAEIGAAVRVVHAGCRKVLHQHFKLEPIRKEAEGSRIILPKGYDAAAVRVTGHIVGQPPFTGALIHRGWQVAEVKLPKIAEGHDTKIIAPAEVEL